MRSSYRQNNYGEVFGAIVDAFKPVNAVELGVLDGYSAFHIGAAQKKNGRGDLAAYDLFEDYPYKHSNYEDVVAFFRHCQNVKIRKMDIWEAHNEHVLNTIDLLHVDVSNTGETVKRIMELWDERMVHGGVILFEGGTEERDQVEWMVKFNKPSIKAEIESNPIINSRYIYGTYLKFPGLTMLLKKR